MVGAAQTLLSLAFAYISAFWNLQSLKSCLLAQVLTHLFHVTFLRLPYTGAGNVAGHLTCQIQKISGLAQQNANLLLKPQELCQT